MEWSKVSDTGIAIMLDSEQAFLRVHEMCGLFLSLYDAYCKVCGINLDVESAIHGEYARADEGEARHFRGIATYPWEALGLYAPGQNYTSTYSDTDIQYNVAKASVD